MFSSTKKLDPNLKSLLASSNIKEYRILIKYRNFPDSISKKINSYRGTVIRKIESCNIICAQVKAKSIELLLEYPDTYSYGEVISRNYIGKTFNAIINILKNNPNGKLKI